MPKNRRCIGLHSSVYRTRKNEQWLAFHIVEYVNYYSGRFVYTLFLAFLDANEAATYILEHSKSEERPDLLPDDS